MDLTRSFPYQVISFFLFYFWVEVSLGPFLILFEVQFMMLMSPNMVIFLIHLIDEGSPRVMFAYLSLSPQVWLFPSPRLCFIFFYFASSIFTQCILFYSVSSPVAVFVISEIYSIHSVSCSKSEFPFMCIAHCTFRVQSLFSEFQNIFFQEWGFLAKFIF